MIEVLKEQDDFLVINKPFGLMVHPDGKSTEKTLCDFLLEQYPEIKSVGEPLMVDGQTINRPGIVHRLDRDTSGVMVIARTQEFFLYMKNEFKERRVYKVYHAFVYGNIKEDTITISAPIGRSSKGVQARVAGKHARGTMREAVTDIRVLGRAEDKSVTFVEVLPKTGRTHQIRVHLKHIYHPIIADPVYAPGRTPLLHFNRTALHARSITFADLSGANVTATAPYPPDFQYAISVMGESLIK